MVMIRVAPMLFAISLAACSTGAMLNSAATNAAIQQSEINLGPDVPLSRQDRALVRKLSGKNISFFYDLEANGSRSRSVSRIRITRNGDVYYFENYGGTVPGQGDNNGEVFRLNKTTNFLAEPKRAAPAASKQLILSYYKGRATLQHGNLTLLIVYGGTSRRNGIAARIQNRFELGFSPDGKTCQVRGYYLQINAANGNQSVGHNIGESQCSVGGAVHP